MHQAILLCFCFVFVLFCCLLYRLFVCLLVGIFVRVRVFSCSLYLSSFFCMLVYSDVLVFLCVFDYAFRCFFVSCFAIVFLFVVVPFSIDVTCCFRPLCCVMLKLLFGLIHAVLFGFSTLGSIRFCLVFFGFVWLGLFALVWFGLVSIGFVLVGLDCFSFACFGLFGFCFVALSV